jgi:hypothetical protein
VERVLGKVLVAGHAPADGQDHQPMPVHQGRKGILVPIRDEPIQQTNIADDRLRYAGSRTDADEGLLPARPRFRVNHHGSRRVLAGSRLARRGKKPKNHE